MASESIDWLLYQHIDHQYKVCSMNAHCNLLTAAKAQSPISGQIQCVERIGFGVGNELR